MKKELDRRTAQELGLPSKDVGVITSEFIKQLTNLIAETEFVQVDGLGTFRTVVHRVDRVVTLHIGVPSKRDARKGKKPKTVSVEIPTRTTIHFRKSKQLKEAIDRTKKE